MTSSLYQYIFVSYYCNPPRILWLVYQYLLSRSWKITFITFRFLKVVLHLVLICTTFSVIIIFSVIIKSGHLQRFSVFSVNELHVQNLVSFLPVNIYGKSYLIF